MNVSFTLPVLDRTQVGEARRRLEQFAASLHLDDTTRGKLAIIVTEVASNLVKYAQGGEIVYRRIGTSDAPGIEVLSLDRGPGMANLGECLRDGYSTSGSPGTGLGAVMRLADVFDIHSDTAVGTAILARVATGRMSQEVFQSGAVCLPKPGEEVCGDDWALHVEGTRAALMVADGLGHGLLAAEAAHEASRVFADCGCRESPTQFLGVAHDALRKTRGAALALASLNSASGQINYAGVGNIAGVIVAPDGTTRSMVSHNGTAGVEVRKMQEFQYAWPAGNCVVMHSDGLATQWRIDKYRGLALKHPGLIAGVLYRDHRRSRDDVTVVVVARNRTAR